MAVIGVEEIRILLDATVVAVSILAGVMACLSGYAASKALSAQASAEILALRINEGIGVGFIVGVPLGSISFIIAI
jgi:hypothetical protein